MIHRFTVGQLRALGSVLLVGCTLLPACTLITDVDRERIPTDPTPVFPEGDAGSDAAVPDPGPGPVEPVDAGIDAGEPPSDAGVDAGDGGNGELIDAGGDAG